MERGIRNVLPEGVSEVHIMTLILGKVCSCTVYTVIVIIILLMVHLFEEHKDLGVIIGHGLKKTTYCNAAVSKGHRELWSLH